MFIINHKGEVVEMPAYNTKNNKTYYSWLWKEKYDIEFKQDNSQQKIISRHLQNVMNLKPINK
jgi:hypothetical protein